jgi:hypothetical protein
MPKRKLSEAQIGELHALHARCNLVLRFLNRHGELGDLAREFEEIIEKSFHTQDLRGLRILQKDLEDWSKDLSRDEQLELETLLRVKLRVDVDNERLIDIAQIHEIEERGRIRNEREYRLVQTRAEELRSSPAGAQEAERLQALLTSY